MKTIQQFGFVRVATVVPELQLGDVEANVASIAKSYTKAAKAGVQVAVYPELSLTGYTIADIVQQGIVLDAAVSGIEKLAQITTKKTAMVVGLPFSCNGKLYNVAAVLADGKIQGLVPKTYLPNYQEFYEQRWYASALELNTTEVQIGDTSVPIGNDLLFALDGIKGAVLGVEICEDLWAPIPPSSQLSLAGATLLANLSASNELVGKADYRRALVSQQSARMRSAYIYCSTGVNESTTDLVFGGHTLIAEDGRLVAQGKRFERDEQMTLADIDIERLTIDRHRTNTFQTADPKDFRTIHVAMQAGTNQKLERMVDAHPFVPSGTARLNERAQEVIAIQSTGLATRLKNTGIDKIVLGLSGGLDSTLALLVAVAAFEKLKLPRKNIYAITMPGFATSDRTKNNAGQLATKLGVDLQEIAIGEGSTLLLKEIDHDLAKQDPTYENAQARYRTLILMSKANQLGALVLGTGDLSEIALGWCTFNGDHISHYNVNASIPKTLVKHLVSWFATQSDFAPVEKILHDIVDTPVSPELTDDQETEDLIGPYELHDFYLYHFVRWGCSPQKIIFLAQAAFGKQYSQVEITKWLKLFITKFFANQWKRSVMADGPKVGTISLSPRGDWRMPSDMSSQAWLREVK